MNFNEIMMDLLSHHSLFSHETKGVFNVYGFPFYEKTIKRLFISSLSKEHISKLKLKKNNKFQQEIKRRVDWCTTDDAQKYLALQIWVTQRKRLHQN